MSKKILLVTIALVLFFGILLYMRGNSDIEVGGEIMGEEVTEVKQIAVCPTMYGIMSKEIVYDDFVFLNVDSTSEGVLLLDSGGSDFVISGRIPVQEENIGEYVHLSDGIDSFSFLSNVVDMAYTSELNNYEIYTDLEEGILEMTFGLEAVEYVENVYDFSFMGILVTSWNNTDYNKATIVHIMENDTERNILSRLPTLFCKTECLEEDVVKLTELFNI